MKKMRLELNIADGGGAENCRILHLKSELMNMQ